MTYKWYLGYNGHDRVEIPEHSSAACILCKYIPIASVLKEGR